ncbi:peptidase M23 [Desulfotomaculum copahuensis]|uniref:Peptidase M23 n=2 Tax=Desulfotomaculum copahuensis TaxID=1838280 RepID=A0A1B7LG36_9FIRM|nr:peptidase M23 [Desulfotomaculum copahuensis]
MDIALAGKAVKLLGGGRKSINTALIIFIFLIPLFFIFIFILAAIMFSGMLGISTGFNSGAATNIAKNEIPANLLPVFVSAQQKYGVSWAVLAAIAKVETDFGQNMFTSSAGAVGFMQILPSTWESYKQDGNGDGIYDPYNPWDAIYTAANYLKACGFETDPSKAIWDYNHAWWYVREVMSIATSYSSDMLPTGNGVWPLPGHTALSSGYGYRYLDGKGEFHAGIDIPAPKGTPVVSAISGKVIMAHYNDGFGICVEVESDSCMTLYGHLSGVAVYEGETVSAGQTIGYVGSTGYSTGNHLHFGVYVNGQPCNPLEWLKVPSGNY